ncbi:glycoside hydrolase family 47 protein [Leucogyrophana mollusca]|uniref:Glycoside hydrolase family 47 protein n=1 Tax=Leucogyrophana mollusca TaxID=85980 RepID=A0ACB8C1W6_9AGAM|nr:glycoside hydrolase family 47 protein [Leucogyrophana mollusca]
MTFRRWFVVALAASTSTLGALVQKQGLQLPPDASTHRDAVEALFNTSYQAYKDYAWGHDDLLPVTKSFTDGRNGWGASIADAMSTMYIMGLTDWFEEAVNHTAATDFSKTNDTVKQAHCTANSENIFIYAAYELSGEKYPVLIQKAQELADHMAYAWVGNNPVPYNDIDFSKNSAVQGSTGIAAAGTLTLEWNLLSKYTNNDTYRQLGEKPVLHIIGLPNPPLPGLPGQGLDPSTGKSTDTYVTWGGGSDSYFEYLIKYPRLTNTDDNTYTDAWLAAVDSSVRELLRYSTVDDHLYLADYDGTDIRHVGSHLACFYGGNWILGGKMANNETIVNYGLQLTDACWNTYASTATGIGPESFAYISSDGNYTGGSAPDASAMSFYNEHGFYITGADYILRPEVLESNFYAWRATGDTKYLDNAASAIKSFQDYLPTTVAFAGINDVNSVDSTKVNDMESFWFAEVLKYLYLTFDDPSHISLDDYVFNTECHPFKAPTAKDMYGST